MQHYLPDCTLGREAALAPGLQVGMRCNTSRRTAWRDAMQQCLTDIMLIHDEALPA